MMAEMRFGGTRSILLLLFCCRGQEGFEISAVGPKKLLVSFEKPVNLTWQFDSGGIHITYFVAYIEKCPGAIPTSTSVIFNGRKQGAPIDMLFHFSGPVNDGVFRGSGNIGLVVTNARLIWEATNCSSIQFRAGIMEVSGVTVSDDILITIYDPPRISRPNYELVFATEMELQALACEPSGLPRPLLYWTRSQGSLAKLLPPGVYSHVGKLPPFIAEDGFAGNYTCIASNAHGDASVTIELKLRRRLLVTANQRDVIVPGVGTSASLACTGESLDRITQAWWERGGIPVQDRDNVTHHWLNPGFVLIIKLLVRVDGPEYREDYTCNFRSSRTFSYANLHVTGASLRTTLTPPRISTRRAAAQSFGLELTSSARVWLYISTGFAGTSLTILCIACAIYQRGKRGKDESAEGLRQDCRYSPRSSNTQVRGDRDNDKRSSRGPRESDSGSDKF